MRLKTFFAIASIFCAILIAGCFFLNCSFFCLDERLVFICNKGPGIESNQQEKFFYQGLEEIGGKIHFAELLAKVHCGAGYNYLKEIIDDIGYCGNTEYIISNAYKALGYIGKFDQKAADVLFSEFLKSKDPNQSRDILESLIVTGNKYSIIKAQEIAKREIKEFFSEEEKRILFSCK